MTLSNLKTQADLSESWRQVVSTKDSLLIYFSQIESTISRLEILPDFLTNASVAEIQFLADMRTFATNCAAAAPATPVN